MHHNSLYRAKAHLVEALRSMEDGIARFGAPWEDRAERTRAALREVDAALQIEQSVEADAA